MCMHHFVTHFNIHKHLTVQSRHTYSLAPNVVTLHYFYQRRHLTSTQVSQPDKCSILYATRSIRVKTTETQLYNTEYNSMQTTALYVVDHSMNTAFFYIFFFCKLSSWFLSLFIFLHYKLIFTPA